MRIAFIGTRGVPARYGGFETCAEEIGRRLAARGHEITVYARSRYYPERIPEWAGMRIVYKPALRLKFLETLSHTALALADAAKRGFDAVLVFNAANSPLLVGRRRRGAPVVLHADGMEWMRGKWGRAGRAYFRWAERLAARGRTPIIADSEAIAAYYRDTYGRDTVYIAYGADIPTSARPEVLKEFGLEPGRYVLQITRFEPENNPDLTVRAFEGLETGMKLVLVGGAPYRSKTGQMIRAARDPRLVRPGFIYDAGVRTELLCHCAVYVHGNEVGGTNPALLEAMAAGGFVIARDVPFNREVLGEAGLYFRKDAADLRAKIAWAFEHPAEVAAMKARAVEIIRARFSWERVADAYEKLFRGLVSAWPASS